MFGGNNTLDSDAPQFVLATRLYVHYKFKARKTFNPQAALIDVRASGDAKLLEMADHFEAARFPHGGRSGRSRGASRG